MPLATPDEIVTALKDYGLKVVEWNGWRTRGRPYPFDPYGQAWHHDAFQEQFSDEAAARYMTEQGRPDLPPPLCNGAIGNLGTVFLCAYGNANHAGWNERDVHERLRRGAAPLGWAKDDPDTDEIVGNPHLWGWECRNAGTGHDPWDQLDVMMRAGAAMADCCSWTAMASAAHGELTARKPDPVGFDMTAFRAGIARAQAAHNAPPEEEDLVYKIVWIKSGSKPGASYRVLFATGKDGKPFPVEAHDIADGDLAGWRKRLEEIPSSKPLPPSPYIRIVDGPYRNVA